MRVLVTGAAGFLGSHLSQWHLTRGDQVTGLDDHSSSLSESRHLRVLRAQDDFTYLRKSTVDPLEDLLRLPYHERFDLIYNFGCPASPPTYQAKPLHTLNTCFTGTQNVLRLAQAHGACMIHASTSEVYGDPETSPQVEAYRGCVNSFGPRACYDEGKRVAEALCYEYQKRDVDVRLIRIFNTYGPHMDLYDGRVVTNFIRQALSEEDITVYGDGQQTRSFCYVQDLIRGIVDLAALSFHPDLRGPINLGNPGEFTVEQLAARVIAEVASQSGRSCTSRVVFHPLPVDDPMQRRPDVTRAHDLLGWVPKVDLEEGLRRTIKYFRFQG